MRDLMFETGEAAVLRYRLMEDAVPRDITGMSFTFAAKERNTDTGYTIAPVSGDIGDAEGGEFSFELIMPSTPFGGVYSVVMEDALGKRTVLTGRGGDRIRVVESLID